MFGCSENGENGKQGNENKVKNGIFSYLVQKRKEKRQKMGWKIIPPVPHFLSSQFERKTKEKR